MNMEFQEFKKGIKDKKVAVVGIGVSNIPLIKKLVEYGAKVTAFDKKDRDKVGEELLEYFDKNNVELSLGEGYMDRLTGFDIVYRTPSMMPNNRYLVQCREEGAKITSEMEEFVRYCPAKIFAVTGSDGKTTSTSVIYEMLKEEGYKTWVGGNIGTPLFDKLDEMKEEDKVVIELSSFQLISMKERINVALITNISPNHLDIHKDMEEYIEAKKNIFKFQKREDLLILNRENEITNNCESEANGRVMKFSINEKIENGAGFDGKTLFVNGKPVCNRDEVKLVGLYNIDNLLGVMAAVHEDVSIESMKKVANEFGGVEHRNEFVSEVRGVKYYNNSIASSPTRTVASIKSFEKPIILIAGGYDKKIPFEVLAKEGFDFVKELILVGHTKDKIKDEFDKEMKLRKEELNIYMFDSFEEAVDKSFEISKPGDIVALTPACASFDLFPNFAVRGNRFKELVRAWENSNK